MRIGVYFPDINPKLGGEFSLLSTIQKEIKEFNDSENQYIFLYHGGNSKELFINSDKFSYLNLDYFLYTIKIRQKIKNKIKRIFRIPYERINVFDEAAKEQNIDIFWFPSPVKINLNYPFIYTVWDLGHREYPYFPEVSRSGWTWGQREIQYSEILYKASFIITGNEAGKKEILENYPVNPAKIRIAEFPVADFCRGTELKPSFTIPEQYFFYPAQFWPHKNHICILEALVYLRDEFNIRPVVFFTGSDKGNKNYIESRIVEYKLENQVKITGFLKAEELKYMYAHATGMIFASLMGPNNMPPIEATYLHCPVIITDLEGHKEQLKDTALYFNGYKPEELARHMQSLLSSKSYRESLIKKQIQLSKNFDKVNYFAKIKTIIDEFKLIRNTWGVDFIHI